MSALLCAKVGSFDKSGILPSLFYKARKRKGGGVDIAGNRQVQIWTTEETRKNHVHKGLRTVLQLYLVQSARNVLLYGTCVQRHL